MSDSTHEMKVNQGRRRLTQGGLAAPIVLATLASKGALADVPYHCSLSGQLSGNQSPNGPNTNPSADCTLGSSAATVKTALTADSTKFKDVFTAKPIYSKVTSGGSNIEIRFTTFPGSGDATLYQVLAANNTSTISASDLAFCRAAVVLRYNGSNDRSVYPLSKTEVVSMFNAAIAGSDYTGTSSLGSFTWSPSQVRAYFAMLYH